MKFIMKICLFTPLFISTFLMATPERGSYFRKILLGVDQEHYFLLTIKRTIPGIYYAYYDSTFIEKYHISSNKLIERQLISATSYQDTTTNGDWKRSDWVPVKAVDLSLYIRMNQITFVIHSGWFSNYKVLANQNGLYMVKDKDIIVKLLSPNQFKALSGITSLRDITFKDCFVCPSTYFFKFEITGPAGYPHQFFIPIPHKEVTDKLAEALNRR